MKTGFLLFAILLVLPACLVTKPGVIRYKDSYNNLEKVNAGIEKTGVQLEIEKDNVSTGRGLNTIKETNPTGVMRDKVFSIISADLFLENGYIILNQTPTNEGSFELSVYTQKDSCQALFAIRALPTVTHFETVKTRLLLNKPPASSGLICGRLLYKGINMDTARRIHIRNIFYYHNH